MSPVLCRAVHACCAVSSWCAKRDNDHMKPDRKQKATKRRRKFSASIRKRERGRGGSANVSARFAWRQRTSFHPMRSNRASCPSRLQTCPSSVSDFSGGTLPGRWHEQLPRHATPRVYEKSRQRLEVAGRAAHCAVQRGPEHPF